MDERGMNSNLEVVERWEELNLDENLLRGVYASGFESPSFIQKTAIKPLLAGKDLRAQAQSGTGKTGAFSIAALQKIKVQEGTQVLVLASTREIALQNFNCLKSLSKFMTDIKIKLLYGGKSVKSDIEGLESSPHIIVGTPGRILHMINESFISPQPGLLFVIDEADELFKKGFSDDVRDIFVAIKTDDTQVAMFSATWEEEELKTAAKLLRDDSVIIDLRTDEQTLKGIDQYYIDLGERRSNRENNDELKVKVLIDIYSKFQISQSIIFVNNVERVKKVHDRLNELGFACGVIHASLSQEEREAAISRFKGGELRTLIASNLVGRGVDVQQLSVVINFDLPHDSYSTYIHRIGRAGRYGRKGAAINFIFRDEVEYLNNLSAHYRTSIVQFHNEAKLK